MCSDICSVNNGSKRVLRKPGRDILSTLTSVLEPCPKMAFSLSLDSVELTM